MSDRTEILRQKMQAVGIPSFQSLSDRTGVSRRAIDTLRKGNAANLRYTDLAKVAEVLEIESMDLISLCIIEPSDSEVPLSPVLTLREEYQRLQRQLELQSQELRSQFERETIQQLESLLLQLPSAAHAAQNNLNMPAKNILPLLRPLDALLEKWGITMIGSVGAEVAYDPQRHQLMEGMDNMAEGDIAIVRYVGYMQGEKLLYRARVEKYTG
ncbi:nucleotide exchange factor GrpE [Pseudanabaena sp. FACHB-1998]|uniref:nucleotide exchange factor GrpE n=1 Tax=Pseudanabaena sp. FACHB-1998 TaxID=2692858 RepID=UPI0016802724|nr:nucleotide exchange factor GrpE [Pseudanabaena sp. FACHB-1998]MBD2178336.1 nucleotide exchange factor GrpE [Pseudanabaena sp. FACHB-1998]